MICDWEGEALLAYNKLILVLSERFCVMRAANAKATVVPAFTSRARISPRLASVNG